MSDCLFCKIVKKEIPADIVFESETVIAFNDIDPQAPVHILVIPKIHLDSITKVKDEHAQIISDVMQCINHITEKKGLVGSGFRIVVNHGADAGQAVPHLHFHILGGRSFHWPPG